MVQEELSWHAAASAHLLEARKRNGRLGACKSRTGCSTCKARRIKCDETKPECQRCQKTGRKCDGYSSSASPAKRQNESSINVKQPQSLRIKDKDRRNFDFFLSFAAPRLAGTFDRDFWCGYVLQLAQTEPIVTDCILAISTLYEHPQFLSSFYSNPSGTMRTHVSNGGEELDVFHVDALVHYNKAIRTFKVRLAEGKVTPSLALLSCLLFLCTEMIRDNVFAALELHTRGADMLQQYEEDLRGEKGSGLLTMIKHMFRRIGTLAPAFVQRRLISIDTGTSKTQDREDFANMADARDALFTIMGDNDPFIEDAHAWKESLIKGTPDDPPSSDEGLGGNLGTMYGVVFRMVTKTPNNVLKTGPPVSPLPEIHPPFYSDPYESNGAKSDAANRLELSRTKCRLASPLGSAHGHGELKNLLRQQLDLLERLDEWLQRFDLTLKRTPTLPETASYLMMYYYSTLIWLSTRLHLAESVFDDFTPHFRRLVDHAAVYLDAKARELPVFTFEIGATPPLFLAAAKCRVPSIRRRALDLMRKAPKKECMHSSVSTSEFARRLMEIEEEGLVSLDDAVVPLECNRIRGPELLKNLTTGQFEVKVERYSEENGFFRIDTAYDLM
ncbi:uncharacterized protein LTR77_001033 [Saxophila tyrrhenica]|uniref:Zn(2)-C6 fungal-type domain-containing protein n=1 Tax=Saxophila tyrrhenica TaxID=1690608 RepID=A0AAV9PRM4_9PEZI|nr:hypothetical protein LTR77_001033 [Saxophila tyrrhenica]